MTALGLLGCGTAPSSPTTVTAEPPALADVIEALFLGSGPIAPRTGGNNCTLSGQWVSFAPEAAVDLVLDPTIGGDGERVLHQAVTDLTSVLHGRFALRLTRTADARPRAGPNQITTTDLATAQFTAICGPGQGCARVTRRMGALLSSVELVQLVGTPSRVKIHELGHAVGLCHISSGAMREAVMSDDLDPSGQERFAGLELQAIRAVYASGLDPGAGTEAFRAAGLIR